MILSKKPVLETPGWLRAIVLAGALMVLPLGLTDAQDDNDLARVTEWLESGVNAAFLTQEQADIMLNALRTELAAAQRIQELAEGNVVRLQVRLRPSLSAADPEIVIEPDAE